MKRFRFLMLVLLIALAVVCFAACDLLGGGKDDTDGSKNNDGSNDPGACTHEYTDVVTEPTCTAGGYTTHTCSKCGDVKKDTEVAAKGHTYTDKVTAPTCSADGYTTHTCTACQSSYKDTYVTMLGHQYDYANATSNSVSCTSCTGGSSTYTWTAYGSSYGFTYDFDRYYVDDVFVGYKISDVSGTIPNTLKIPAVYDGKPVMAIGEYVFCDIERLQYLTIPDTVVELGSGAFSSCQNLEQITLPNTLQRIGSNPFMNTKYMKAQCYESNKQFTYQVRSFIMNNRYFLDAYMDSDETEYVVPEGITVLAGGAFKDHGQVETITLPSTLRYIGADAFLSCSKLKTLNIRKGLVEMGTRPYFVANNRGVLQTVNFEGTEAEWKTVKNYEAFATRYMKYNVKIGG